MWRLRSLADRLSFSSSTMAPQVVTAMSVLCWITYRSLLLWLGPLLCLNLEPWA